MLRIGTILLAFVASASPALAQSAGISIPEPTDGALFAMGVVGLIVGRHIAKRRG
ncbi:hypothetical protein [Novosphingobium taihuense]|uniref:Secreted protein with PEP-CTERM sorting signal n=1 Tax=Novosphingobium taihuense TaxID=260085 RepID=A0A7W7AAA2_9SPHN|nr:hypothetical protein [Novosphingobium taihuense]MBB4613313.1 hypothetical protein [Novosphingobium taihuense]